MDLPRMYPRLRGRRLRVNNNDGNEYARSSIRPRPAARLHSRNGSAYSWRPRRHARARAILPLLPAGICFLARLSVRLRRISYGAPPHWRFLGIADSPPLGSGHAYPAAAYLFGSSASLGTRPTLFLDAFRSRRRGCYSQVQAALFEPSLFFDSQRDLFRRVVGSGAALEPLFGRAGSDRKSTRLNSSHMSI